MARPTPARSNSPLVIRSRTVSRLSSGMVSLLPLRVSPSALPRPMPPMATEGLPVSRRAQPASDRGEPSKAGRWK
ncbi:hypothetical protein D3C87_1320210 [compost metagenome]